MSEHSSAAELCAVVNSVESTDREKRIARSALRALDALMVLAEASKLPIEALKDMRDNGLRFDLNPTHDLSYIQTNAGKAACIWWHGYIQRMDQSIRERAAVALGEQGIRELLK